MHMGILFHDFLPGIGQNQTCSTSQLKCIKILSTLSGILSTTTLKVKTAAYILRKSKFY